MQGFWDDYTSWISSPLDGFEKMTPKDLFLLVGVMIVIVTLWTLILRLITEAIGNA